MGKYGEMQDSVSIKETVKKIFSLTAPADKSNPRTCFAAIRVSIQYTIYTGITLIQLQKGGFLGIP